MEVEIENAITAEGLGDGKKPPLKLPADLPTDGLVLAPPFMAQSVIDGKKTVIVKTKALDLDGKNFILLSQRKALGVVLVGKGEKIDDDEFTELEPKHLITAKIREDWAKAQPSWKKGPLYAWPIKVVQKFDEPLDTNVKAGPQVTVGDVEIDVEKRGPFSRWGGSSSYASWLVKQFPDHETYVEPFGGAASVFFAKERAIKNEVIADLDTEVVHALKTIQGLSASELKTLEGYGRKANRKTFIDLKGKIPKGKLERLHRVLYLSGASWAGGITFSPSKEGKDAYDPRKLKRFQDRLKNVTVERADWKATVEKYDAKNTLFFIDPPYPDEWDDRADDLPNEGRESKVAGVDLPTLGKVLKKIKGEWILALGDTDKQRDFLKSLNVTIRSKELSEARSVVGGGTKKANRYFAFKLRTKKDKLQKIKDVKTYDPSKVSDAVLRDDHRLILAWYATWKKDPEKFKHSLETITGLLRKVLKEAVRRGPEVIQFSPQGMKASVRAFFLEVARDIKLPDTMIKKVALDPGMEVDDLSDPELYAAHWQLHEMFEKEKRTQTGVKGWSTEDIVNLHARVVDELFGRKTKHPAPPDNGLDELSVDFEQNAAKQPEWFTKPTVKIDKREYATINRSGVKRGKEIKIEDVLKHFKTFKLRKPYIYLVGGLANHGKTEGDIDILINDMEDAPDWMQEVIHFRLGRALPPELAERLELHFDRRRGPFTKFVELYDLTVERMNEKNEIKEMRVSVDEEVEKQGAATAEMKAQADKAAKNDKLTLGEFFYQPKPTRAAQPEQLQTLENFMALYKERAEDWLPTVVQKKFDGARHQLHIDGDKITIISEDGGDNTDRFPQTIEELKTLKVKKLVLDAEIERWDGQQHLPREAAAGYINSKDEPDDSEMITNVFDVLYHGEDVHKLGTKERLALLKKLGIKQSTMGVPSLKHRLNAAPGIEVDDLEELERAVRRIRKLPGSEGVVNKQSDAPYTLKVVTPDLWVKHHVASTIGGIVMGRTKTKGGVWVYQYGVLPGKEDPEETVEVKGTKIVPVGDTFATKLDFEEGDGILIEAETVNIVRSPKGLKITAWVPRVIGELDRKTDTVDQVARRAARNLVLQQKDIDEEGKITYRPTRKTVKIGKQEDPYMEIPDEDKTYRYSVSHHHRGKSLHSDLRLGLRPKELLVGWTLNTQIAGSIKEPVITMAEAKRLASRANIDKVSKINWHTGEWARRPKAGTTKLVRTSILSERKAAEPWAWIDVEGKTKDPEEGKAPPVGGTRQFPGVFLIVDQGTVQWGSMKPWLHEYFFTGDGLNYRMFFRLLKISPRKVEKSCEACNTVSVGKQIGWADEETWTDLCEPCTREFVEKQGVTLPPSEEQPFKDEATWLAIYPDDQTPYVLSSDAVKKDWMPPDGISALPREIRKQIPKEFQYWEAKGKKAKTLRDDLVAAIKAKEVEVDVEAPYKSTEKATQLKADWVLQEQTWRGPTQVRVGPTRTRYWVRLDIGRKDLLVFDLRRNPLDNPKVGAFVDWDSHKASMKLKGDISPGHYLNPTKETPSFIEVLDRGKAEVLSLSDDLIKIRFQGKKLKELIGVKRSNDEWLWSPTQAAPEVDKTEKRVEFELNLPIVKVEVNKGKNGKEKRLITGIVLKPNVVDAQGDTISAEVIEKAAHQFVRDYNKSTEMGLMHNVFGENGIELVESWVAPIAFKLNNRQIKKGTWVMTAHVTDDTVWKKIKSGEITGFSIGGVATVAAE